MATVQVLPDSLINKIAAGEVIERPASAVKELVENAIDAGATEVECEIVGGGLDTIIVIDNGCGMSVEDAEMAWARHATSKIASQDDLDHIGTLGFRGEALASIASVSRVEMETKMKEEVSGVKLKIIDGKIAAEEECGCPEGTKITISHLFYNTPARKKYMKAENTEYKHILELMQNFALAHPDVAFKLINDGKEIVDVSPAVLEDRITDVMGNDVGSNLVPVYFGGAGFKISGFLGKPDISRSNRKGQFIFLNGRVIQNHLIAHAVKEAYHSMLMHGKHPWFLLNLEVNLDDVDVNVHPRKLEVRFLKQNEVYRSVLKSVEEALNKHLLMPEVKWDSEPVEDRDPRGIKERVEHEARQEAFETVKMGIAVEDPEECPIQPISQIAESYILAQDEEGLVVIDQHAAHERVMYDKLMRDVAEKKVVSQPMLAPLTVDLSAQEAKVLRDNMEFFVELGFEIDEFGGDTFVIGAVPADVAGEDTSELLRGVLDDLMNEKRTSELSVRREKVIHYTACRSAIKFGQKLSYEEMKGLLEQLYKIDRKETCPHGRPTMLRLTYDELEKRFRRKL